MNKVLHLGVSPSPSPQLGDTGITVSYPPPPPPLLSPLPNLPSPGLHIQTANTSLLYQKSYQASTQEMQHALNQTIAFCTSNDTFPNIHRIQHEANGKGDVTVAPRSLPPPHPNLAILHTTPTFNPWINPRGILFKTGFNEYIYKIKKPFHIFLQLQQLYSAHSHGT